MAWTLSRLGFVAILLAYFLVWLPQPAAGLSFIGLEMGEWVKFIPEVASGEIVPGRNLYYVPPLSLGVMMLAVSAGWPNRRGRTWAFRLLAVLVAALASPSIVALLEEPAEEFRLRLAAVGLFMLTALTARLWGPWLARSPRRSLLLLGAAAVAGAFLPLWAYVAMRPAFARILGETVGFGSGVWLNTAGHLLVLVAAGLSWRARRPTDHPP